ncbi:PREDICTED: kinetochore-associated protein NSL1 homolog [Chinchilla lanigera]|uniref:NSL1 component of MIS12 kinetochore complex n=1 Tax=Chinchilla lanigera TaxID=34839 RepID=A0A8C2W2Q3_CHILA|nr:PREDICTED: kinetochore-associated protein NSL1 homolog [Chinchilla lanigera]
MAGAFEPVIRTPRLDEALAASTNSQASVPTAPREDFRVRCTSKRAMTEILALCRRFVQNLGDALPEEIREAALRDVQWTFERAVQENVSINGQAWQEASDNSLMDSDIKVLEDQFDEIIVDIATKRKQYPRKILECVIKTLKAQHEILKQYRPVVHPLDLTCDPDPASCMENLKCRGETIAEEISEAMKTLPVLIEQADGFSQVLRMQPIIQLQRIHQEVFSSGDGKPDATPESSITQIETTPTETAPRPASDVVLKRRRPSDCPQRRRYPLRPKRINLHT